MNINKKVTSKKNKTCEKKPNDLLREVNLISTKWSTKNSTNNYSNNGGKYFSLNRSENYFVFQPAIKCFKLLII